MKENWISIKDKTPDTKEYVLIETPFCKYPAIVGFWDGYYWRDADGATIIKNVSFWKPIRLPKGSERKVLLKENGQKVEHDER